MIWLILLCFGEGPYGLVIHGGAGTIKKEQLGDGLEAQYRQVLQQALDAGYAKLQAGESSESASIATIMVLEDSSLFNAGRGAVFTHEGKNEFDASIMLGSGRAGACAAIRNVRNPILLAQAIMNKTPHVMLVGEGAQAFAVELGLKLEPDPYFFTERRWNQLQKAQEAPPDERWQKFGTVGVVALDQQGQLAAATSTGGLTNKRFGRVGDSPIIGAGTYCDNQTCGVSGTGQGEFFMRGVTAYDVSAMMTYLNDRVEVAAQKTIDKLTERGGSGGLIAMDAGGNVAMVMNTAGMYRGIQMSDGRKGVWIFKDENP
ncbi:MAG: isoaspartyl peptidase/L-asparaginase [Acidobacteria bacterium]|nr:isoaspartyl peptidase/L-asparaginase [Acidobacteriota bacterium]